MTERPKLDCWVVYSETLGLIHWPKLYLTEAEALAFQAKYAKDKEMWQVAACQVSMEWVPCSPGDMLGRDYFTIYVPRLGKSHTSTLSYAPTAIVDKVRGITYKVA